jgi:hypothetical protein
VTRASRLSEALLLRLPIALLVSALLFLWLSLARSSLNSDSAVFGLMGDDLLRYGSWPTLTYGQSYILSLTPYSYALWRALFPALEPATAFALGGAVFSLSGLWLVYEALLTSLRGRSEKAYLPAVVFCLLVAASPRYVLDLANNNSNEISLFVVGLLFLAATRLETAQEGAPPRMALHGWLFGFAAGYAFCSRPNTLAYALVLGLGLALRRNHLPAGLRARLLRLRWPALGALVGILPLVLHHLARGRAWPYVHAFTPSLGSLEEMRSASRVVVSEVMPSLLQLDRPHLACGLAVTALAAAALSALCLAVLRRSRQLSAADIAWPIGTLAILGLMVLVPILARDAESRRYALHAYLAVAWIFCRFGLPRSRGKWLGIALVAALAATACLLWKERLASARREEHARRILADETVPLLERSGTVVLADYSDAYLLRFLSGGELRVEAFPWQLVRTYGYLRADEFDGPLVWFLSRGNTRALSRRLTRELGADETGRIAVRPLDVSLEGRRCQLWISPDGRRARDLMLRQQPLYFSTSYPP